MDTKEFSNTFSLLKVQTSSHLYENILYVNESETLKVLLHRTRFHIKFNISKPNWSRDYITVPAWREWKEEWRYMLGRNDSLRLFEPEVVCDFGPLANDQILANRPRTDVHQRQVEATHEHPRQVDWPQQESNHQGPYDPTTNQADLDTEGVQCPNPPKVEVADAALPQLQAVALLGLLLVVLPSTDESCDRELTRFAEDSHRSWAPVARMGRMVNGTGPRVIEVAYILCWTRKENSPDEIADYMVLTSLPHKWMAEQIQNRACMWNELDRGLSRSVSFGENEARHNSA